MPVTSMEDDEAILKPDAGKPDVDEDGAEDDVEALDAAAADTGDDDGGDDDVAAAGDDDDGEELDAGYERDPATGRFTLSPKAKSDMYKLRAKRREAEQSAARERERADAAERRLAEFERTASQEETERLEAEITSLKARKKAALESTDLEAYDEASEALLEARLRRERLGAGAQRPERGDDAPAPRAASGNGMAPFARAWVEANADWFDPNGKNYDPDRRERALRENTRLAAKYDVNDPKLYDALNRAVKGPARDGGDDTRRVQHNGPSPPTRPGVGPARRPRRLSSDDIASMRNYGLDPSDANARREWLKNQAR
jgi:hypothetical protein